MDERARGRTLNASRLQAIEAGQTGIARKVLDAVPIAEAWAPAKIMAEVRRHGTNLDLRIFEGCMTSLVDAGLVRQTGGGAFQRVAAKVRTMTEQADDLVRSVEDYGAPAVAAAAVPPKDAPELIERFERIGAHLRSFAKAFSVMADEIETLALEASEQIAKAGEGDEQLRKLRDVLQGLVK